MATKRGRKRKTEMYFGPSEEEAVIKFLNCRYVQIVDLYSGKTITITHNLGKHVVVGAHYIKPNLNSYGSDDKFLYIDVEIKATNFTDKTVDIIGDFNIQNLNITVTNEIERDLIFNEWLKHPLDKMIEAIIRKYKLYRKGETFEELHSDTASFLMTKVHKFDVLKGKKAYSYFGTIAKNYCLGLLIKDDKHQKITSSYEDVSENLDDNHDLSYVIDSEHFSMDDFIKRLSDGIKAELDDETLPTKKKLNENERKVGLALLEILSNWEVVFDSMQGGTKYNKVAILETMRNFTNLSTKDIRIAMKRYKELYDLLKGYGL